MLQNPFQFYYNNITMKNGSSIAQLKKRPLAYLNHLNELNRSRKETEMQYASKT
jgi:hypothetical protein